MNKVEGKKKVICLFLLGSIFLTLLFIFGNSLASKEKSQELSDKVNETVGEVITVITGQEDSSLEDFFTKYHRKIAHFLEFAFLGLQVALLLCFSNCRSASCLLSGALFSFAVASIDEGIQMLTGRGDQVADIFIDVLGYLSFYFIGVLVVCFLIWCHQKKSSSVALCAQKCADN